jgi:uroporphyrinogen decarboxylase
MTPRENKLRAIRFETPDYIPVSFHINGACWHHYDNGALQDLMEAHPLLFPGFVRRATVTPSSQPNQLRDTPYTDPWGCVWQSSDDGITGAVHGHPLADWAAFDAYVPPDPDTTDGTFPVDWGGLRERVRQQKADGKLVTGGLPHGHTFLRLQDIRGYENLLCDMIDDDPRLARLIRLVADFNYRYVLNWMTLAPDIMSFPDDLGMQVGPMVSPECFQRYIQPVYTRLMKPARDCGCLVHMHSDGDIRTLAEGLVKGGVDVINLQDLVNGLDWIAARFAGRVCVDLDIDRQVVTPRGTPAEIDRLIRTEVETLGSKKGGLLLIYGLYPGVPLRNAAAVMDAMERYTGFYAG